MLSLRCFRVEIAIVVMVIFEIVVIEIIDRAGRFPYKFLFASKALTRMSLAYLSNDIYPAKKNIFRLTIFRQKY